MILNAEANYHIQSGKSFNHTNLNQTNYYHVIVIIILLIRIIMEDFLKQESSENCFQKVSVSWSVCEQLFSNVEKVCIYNLLRSRISFGDAGGLSRSGWLGDGEIIEIRSLVI